MILAKFRTEKTTLFEVLNRFESDSKLTHSVRINKISPSQGSKVVCYKQKKKKKQMLKTTCHLIQNQVQIRISGTFLKMIIQVMRMLLRKKKKNKNQRITEILTGKLKICKMKRENM